MVPSSSTGSPCVTATLGDGPPTVFVHGVYVGGSLWSGLADRLTDRRCILPTWPLGAHRDPAPEADLSARATARRIPALLDRARPARRHARRQRHRRRALPGRAGHAHPRPRSHRPPRAHELRQLRALPAEGLRPRWSGSPARCLPSGALLLRTFATKAGQRFFLKSVCSNPPTRCGGHDRVFEGFVESAASRKDALRVTQSLEPSVTMEAVDALRAFAEAGAAGVGRPGQALPARPRAAARSRLPRRPSRRHRRREHLRDGRPSGRARVGDPQLR